MKRTLNEAISMAIRLMVILFVVLFGATSCYDEHFVEGEKAQSVVGDTIINFNDFALNHSNWSYSNGLATSEPYFDGYVEYKVNEEVVKTDLIDHENAPMRIEWKPIAETTGADKKMYLGYSVSEAKNTESHTNQKVNFKKYERECKLSFVGMEVTLTGSWYEASLGSSNIVACRYDSTTVADQDADYAMVNGVKEEIDVDGQKYNRLNVIAKAMNHFTDMPANNKHSEEMNIEYSVLVPVDFVPGEKFYEGSIAGNGSYTKASEESYESTLELTHIFTQDGKQIKEQETVSGEAVVKTWVEGDNTPKVWSSANIGNPSVSVNTSISENYYQKSEYIYAKMYTTVWTYTWTDANTGESFRKEVHSEVERLYYRREAGKEVAMPYGETSTSFSNFNAGSSVEKSENGKKYEAYPNGMVYFSGSHKSSTGNLNDAIEGLSVGQEFWVAKEDKFLGFDKDIIPGNNNKDAQIIITEHWEISGDKEIVFSQSGNYTFSVSEQQRVFGENLELLRGLEKSPNTKPYFNEVSEGQFVRTVTDTYVAKFNLCEVKAIATYNEAYIEYRGERIDFEFAAAEVSYVGINNPTATEVEADGKLYSRKAYEVTFKHNLLGNKVASVLVDKEVTLDPTTPDEWGKLDIKKTKAFGGLAWSWKTDDANPKKLVPFVSGTIITDYGVISFWEGGSCFNRMNTNLITERLGNALKAEGPEYLIPTYIKILTDPNKHWGYQDVNGQYRAEINGVDIELLKDVSIDKPFIAEGGNATVYQITENGNSARVVIMYNGNPIFSEVFAK